MRRDNNKRLCSNTLLQPAFARMPLSGWLPSQRVVPPVRLVVSVRAGKDG